MLWMIVILPLAVQAKTCPADHDCLQQTLVTSNAGLKPQIPLYESRKFHIAQAIKDTDADIVCLQEVLYEEDLARIMKSLQVKYPFSWSFLHSGTYTAIEAFKSNYPGKLYKSKGEKAFPCKDPAFRASQQCLKLKCASAEEGLSLLRCLFKNCLNEGFDLSTDCLSCLSNSVTSAQTAVSKCARSINPGRNRFHPEGIVVFSKKPILFAKKIRYIPDIKQLYPRDLLEVLGTGKVLSTHMTSDLTGIGIPFIEVKLTEALGIKTYAEQKALEIARIKELYDGQTVILAGDLNTGPAVPSQNVSGVLPQNYDALIAQGFDSPYVEQVGKCTYCNENPIAVNETAILDHILLNGYRVLEATRILDNPANPLSDHYGVSVGFCRREFSALSDKIQWMSIN